MIISLAAGAMGIVSKQLRTAPETRNQCFSFASPKDISPPNRSDPKKGAGYLRNRWRSC